MREKKSEQIGIRLTPTTKAKLEEICEAEDRTYSYIISRLISEATDRRLQDRGEDTFSPPTTRSGQDATLRPQE